MGILAKGSDFTPAPEGQYQGVCVDVEDDGMVEREYNGIKKLRHEIRIVFQIEGSDDNGPIRTENGSRFTVSNLFGLGLSDKGNLKPFLESWRGKKFTQEEKDAGFDVERLLGANALIQVVHNNKNDKTYANISSIMPWNTQWGEKITPEKYVRKINRKTEEAPPAEASAPKAITKPPNMAAIVQKPDMAGDEVPF